MVSYGGLHPSKFRSNLLTEGMLSMGLTVPYVISMNGQATEHAWHRLGLYFPESL